MRNLLVLLVALLPACAGSIEGDGDDSAPRDVSGRVDAASFALDDAAMLAHAADGRVFVAPVVDGRFTLTLPAGVDYRLLLVEPIDGGGFRIVAHVTWPTASQPYWAHLEAGGELGLGVIEAEPHDAGASPTPHDLGVVADAGSICDGGHHDDGDGGHHDDGGSGYGSGGNDYGGNGSDHGSHDGGGNVCDGGGKDLADGGAHAGAHGDGGASGGMHGNVDGSCHEEDGATACDPNGDAPDGHCAGGGAAGVDEHVDDQKCHAAEQQMQSHCPPGGAP